MSNEFDNLTLHTDAYEINMMQTYFQAGLQNRRAVFEVYFRKMPFENGFAIFAGLEKVINYIKDINFMMMILSSYVLKTNIPKNF
ncbi:hypothetical protein AKUA1202_03450 [Apilactobacillus kunkeei]|nr:hypothetical protein AKUA1202_03450 [Apilactobacillus kunkeei]